jgi:hypothetical protein
MLLFVGTKRAVDATQRSLADSTDVSEQHYASVVRVLLIPNPKKSNKLRDTKMPHTSYVAVNSFLCSFSSELVPVSRKLTMVTW